MKLIASLLAIALVGPSLAQSKAPDQRPESVQKPKSYQRLTLGSKVPHALTLKDIDGNQHDVSKSAGKITVVNFWSTRCPVQKAWDPTLTRIVRDFEKKGVRFLMVDSNGKNGELVDKKLKDGEKPYREIRKVLAEKELPYTVLVDADNLVADVFGARTTPDIFVFDESSKLVYRGLIDDDMRGKPKNNYLRDTLVALVAGEKVTPKETRPKGCAVKRSVTDRVFEAAKPRRRGARRDRGTSGGK